MKFHRQILLCVLWLCSHARAQVQTANAIQKLLEENEGNSTALSQLKSAPWVNSPTVRGSIEILWTCLVTLVACVYTVLHLNIPPKTGQWANLLNKIRWVCIAIILPETVVFLAARQLSEAIGLKKALQEQLMANGDERTEQEIDLGFCFFVVMGGFQISSADDGIEPGPAFHMEGYLPDHSFILRLSAAGFLKLVKQGEINLLRVIKATNINDRSKASVLQKALILIQVSWMALQCIVRKAHKLPITLLEIHTMAHVVCALILYVLWIQKPLDISHPEIINSNTDGIRKFLALSVQSQLCKIDGVEFVLRPARSDVSISHVSGQSIPLRTGSVESGDSHYPRQIPSQRESHEEGKDPEASQSVAVFIGETLLPSGLAYKQDESTKIKAPESLSLTPSDLTRLRRAGTFLQDIQTQIVDDENDNHIRISHPDYEDCLAEYGNYSFGFRLRYNRLYGLQILFSALFDLYQENADTGPQLSKTQLFLTFKPLFAFFPVVYGTIHLLAWDYSFPSDVERRMWRVCSVTACSAQLALIPMKPVVKTLVFFAKKMMPEHDKSKSVEQSKHTPIDFVEFFILAIVMLMSALNLSSRVFLTVESFISLRSLPIGAYVMPSWLQMMPHL